MAPAAEAAGLRHHAAPNDDSPDVVVKNGKITDLEKLEEQLNQLLDQARSKAIATLTAINAQAADQDYIDIDDTGGVLFVDPPPPDEVDEDEYPIEDSENGQYPLNVQVQTSGVPIYHSKPGATVRLGSSGSHGSLHPSYVLTVDPFPLIVYTISGL
jgi:hypothetical protein